MPDHIAQPSADQDALRILPFPDNPNYLVREDGAIRRIGGTWLKPSSSGKRGYLAVGLWSNNRGKNVYVHAAVCITFNGPRPSPLHHAAHDDGDKSNNWASNVIWKTKIENEADKVVHGTTNRGERNGMAKLTDEQVVTIRAEAAGKPRGIIAALARQYGVSSSAISSIVNNKRRSK